MHTSMPSPFYWPRSTRNVMGYMSLICMFHAYTGVMLNMTYKRKAKYSSNMSLQIVYQGLSYSYLQSYAKYDLQKENKIFIQHVTADSVSRAELLLLPVINN